MDIMFRGVNLSSNNFGTDYTHLQPHRYDIMFKAVNEFSNNFGTDNTHLQPYRVMFIENSEEKLDNNINESPYNTFHKGRNLLCHNGNQLYRIRLDNSRVYEIIMDFDTVILVRYIRG